MTAAARWDVHRVAGIEVFTDPAGVEWVRVPTAATAERTVTFDRTPGLPPLHLRRQTAEAVTRRAARKARRLARRTARLKKARPA